MDDQPIADEVGDWTATKLRILSDYAVAYSKVLTQSKRGRLKHAYVDGFAGSGIDRMRTSGALIAGSLLQVLEIQPLSQNTISSTLTMRRSNSSGN